LTTGKAMLRSRWTEETESFQMIKTKHTYTKLDASLSFRVGVTAAPVGPKLDRPGLVYEATKEYAEADREIMLLIMVDAKNQMLSIETHSVGAVDNAAIYPREIFRSLLLKNASSFILVHNHPSGDPEPSFADKEITRDVLQGAHVLGIKLLDHVILGRGCYFSMADKGLLESFKLDYLSCKR